MHGLNPVHFLFGAIMIPNTKDNCRNFAHILVHNHMTIRQLRRFVERVLRKRYIDNTLEFNKAVTKFNDTANLPFTVPQTKAQEIR